MGARLIIVSNRVAVPEPGNKPMAGGLVVAVKAALRNRTVPSRRWLELGWRSLRVAQPQ